MGLKPVVKWAGGKRQLLSIIDKNLPIELKKGEIKTYIEPFLGGGAMFFHIVQNYNVEKVILNDINKELMNVYRVIRDDVNSLIKYLKNVEDEYLYLNDENRKKYFYNKRQDYNMNKKEDVETAGKFIFLNRTCFNGLYRVNKKGEFNVPYGRYKNPTILDEVNLTNVSLVLKDVKLYSVDFENIKKYVDDKTFVYFDPPYRPLDATSNFTSYSRSQFNDDEQKRLKNFYEKLDKKGAKLLLSNSDPKNTDVNDDFFDKLYRDYNIKRVFANRMINSNGNNRGKVTELLISNY
ncbi:MAG: DNA adenine methylase [Tissierellia bacterium]|nr:DNA adenine methylase [Tissierellia bacterium]